MVAITPERTLIDYLVALKTQYQEGLSEVDEKAAHFREQLSHVNALLLDQLIPSHKMPLRVSIAPTLAPSAQLGGLDHAPFAFVEAGENVLERSVPEKTAIAQIHTQNAQASIKGKRSPLPLLPAYKGLKRLEAIAQVLESTPGQEVTIDRLAQALFGDLSTAALKAERLKLKTLLYQGTKLGLWQKAATPSSYLIGKSGPTKITQRARQKSTAPRTTQSKPAFVKTSTQRNSLPLLPIYGGLKKQDAIAQVLAQKNGAVLHQDTIIQALYGDLSLEALKAERVRIKTALLMGVKQDRWQKAATPSSYFSTAKASKRASQKPTAKAKNPRKTKTANVLAQLGVKR
jgi:hypothetical protein